METVPQPESSLGRNISDGVSDLDLLDQLLSVDGWLEFPDCPDGLQAATPSSMSPFNSLSFSPLLEVNSSGPCSDRPVNGNQDDVERSAASTCTPGDETLAGNLDRLLPLNSTCSVSADLSTPSPSCEPGTSWRIQPRDSNFSVRDRFLQALDYIQETQRDFDVLVQLWVPVKRGDQLFLTTYSQPFSLNPNCEKLVNFRKVSTGYQFSAEVSSGKALGLPGRVYLGKLPEWTPDVRFFSSCEYPRVDYAQRLDIRGSIALPVFSHGSRSCLGVVEVIMTTQKINYTSELENICNALQAVDLRTSSVVTVPQFKVSSGSYQAALPEILEVLKAVCRKHKLPLAQTWIPCFQQGKRGIRHSDENYRQCVSTADASCYINDPSMMGFYEACSEHHLLRGQGVAGKAFTMNQPCFVSDVTAASKDEYPLSHHAKMFGLKGAVAIHLRSILAGNADFVLEFFLPTNCVLLEEQMQMLNSLSRTMQQVCQTLRVLTAKELADEARLQSNKITPADCLFEKSSSEAEPGQKCETVTSLEAHTMEVSGKIPPLFMTTIGGSNKKTSHVFKVKSHETERFGITTDIDHEKTERFGITSDRDDIDEILPTGKISSRLAKDISDNENSLNFDSSCSEATKTTEKRRRKTEKTVSLEVLRNYFAGSLKDAAKSIGVCPTTLKRICRQHGITRWPSRKIKKVDHSLRKLQVVIDSVHGADKAIQLSSLYKDFTTAPGSGAATVSTLNQNGDQNCAQDGDAKLSHPHLSSSHSSSSCTHASTSSLSSSSEHCTLTAEPGMEQEDNIEERVVDASYRANNHMDLDLPTQSKQLCPDSSQNQKLFGGHCSSGSLSPSDNNRNSWMRVKATYGAEKVRLRLNPIWSFDDLKHEILMRFNVDTKNSVNLRYFDDESEWVLLTCDADLQECIHIYRSADIQPIKISIQPVVNPPIRASSCGTGLSS